MAELLVANGEKIGITREEYERFDRMTKQQHIYYKLKSGVIVRQDQIAAIFPQTIKTEAISTVPELSGKVDMPVEPKPDEASTEFKDADRLTTEELNRIFEVSGKTKAEFAASIEYNPSYVQMMLKGDRGITQDFSEAVMKVYPRLKSYPEAGE